MKYDYFSKIFSTLQIPVVVCEYTAGSPIAFINQSARIMLNPLITSDELKAGVTLPRMLRFVDASAYERFLSSIDATGIVHGFHASVLTFEDAVLPLMLSANCTKIGGTTYIIIYLYADDDANATSRFISESALSNIFQIAYNMPDVDTAINKILAFMGNYVHVSRVYIFEEASSEYVSNTYEWCAPGIAPMIEELQKLKKTEHNFDQIVHGGLYVTDDIRDLPPEDRNVLEMQGIKSIAIVPLRLYDNPFGYIGLDECSASRVWSSKEVQLIKDVSPIIASLIARRDQHVQLRRSLNMLQLISDHSNSVIYATDVETFRLVFVNKAFENLYRIDAGSAIGKTCFSILYPGQDGPCSFCPVSGMVGDDQKIIKQNYQWELQNPRNKKWYLTEGTIINWVDGRLTHLINATEITHQKEYEAQLEEYASMDMMTGAYNREWGLRLLSGFAQKAQAEHTPMSLVFIDLDRLKYVNDTYGHETGDDMLISAVEILHGSVRKSDVLLRYGGDEFILLLQCAPDIAARIMHNITGKIAAFNETGAKVYKLEISYGITPFDPDDETSIDVIIARADKLMYENKMQKYAAR